MLSDELHDIAPVVSDALGTGSGRYYEPFFRSGRVYFHRTGHGLVDHAFLSNEDHGVINFWRAVQRDPQEFLRVALQLLQWRPAPLCYRSTQRVKWETDDKDQIGPHPAARFLWLDRVDQGLPAFPRKQVFQAAKLLESASLGLWPWAAIRPKAGDSVFYAPTPDVDLKELRRTIQPILERRARVAVALPLQRDARPYFSEFGRVQTHTATVYYKGG